MIAEDDLPTTRRRSMGMLTDKGLVRDGNEDAVMAANLSISTHSGVQNCDIMMVADGMGGCACGEVASQMAISSVAGFITEHLCRGYAASDILGRAFLNANRAILEYAKQYPEAGGMGTTLVCALIMDDVVHLASVGDSRAYIAGNAICQITKDHTYVQTLVDQGSITADESRCHPARAILTKALGMADFAGPQVCRFELDAAEALILCSDGVTAHLDDADILDLVSSSDAFRACRDIVDMANGRGGSDNVSVVVLLPHSIS